MVNIAQIIVKTKEELSAELNNQTDEIIVEGTCSQIISEIKKGQLNETETLGYHLGYGGYGMLFDYVINRVLGIFDPASKEDKKIRRQIERLYVIRRLTKDSFLLHLRQLDY